MANEKNMKEKITRKELKGELIEDLKKEMNKPDPDPENKETVLLKDLLEEIEEKENKDIGERKNYTFRLNERLMENIRNYSELTGNTITDTVNKGLNKILENKILIREEQEKPVPVYTNDKKEQFLGYVNYNNYLDVWNGETYCYDNRFIDHRGLSKIILEDKEEYILIKSEITNNSEFKYDKPEMRMDFIARLRQGLDIPAYTIGITITEDQAIKEILKTNNFDLLVIYPELKKELKNKYPKEYDTINKIENQKMIKDLLAMIINQDVHGQALMEYIEHNLKDTEFFNNLLENQTTIEYLQKDNIKLMETIKYYETVYNESNNILNNLDDEKINQTLEILRQTKKKDITTENKEIKKLRNELKEYKEKDKKIYNELQEIKKFITPEAVEFFKNIKKNKE